LFNALVDYHHELEQHNYAPEEPIVAMWLSIIQLPLHHKRDSIVTMPLIVHAIAPQCLQTTI
jgi:hypothetical protein